MNYEVVVKGVGILYFGDSQSDAEKAYHRYVSSFGKERSVVMMNDNETLFSHDIRTFLWQERGRMEARAEKDCFYLHDGEKYQVVVSKNYFDVSEYTEAELQMMYAAWVAGWTSYHNG